MTGKDEAYTNIEWVKDQATHFVSSAVIQESP